jgi:hypothetical protein
LPEYLYDFPVQAIPWNTVEGSWTFLERFPQEQIDELFSTFHTEQQVLFEYLLTQDEEWFPEEKQGGFILKLGFFLWTVFRGAKRGILKTVTDDLLCEVLKERNEHLNLMEYESELRAREIGQCDMMKHPQFNLLMFVFEKTIEGHDRDGENLIPRANKAAYHHLNVTILALDKAAS